MSMIGRRRAALAISQSDGNGEGEGVLSSMGVFPKPPGGAGRFKSQQHSVVCVYCGNGTLKTSTPTRAKAGRMD
jgi:hypothetical protein